MATKQTTKTMSDDHKAALETGRSESRAVRAYLEALRASKPRRGRKRTVESINKRLAAIEDELASATAIDELRLVQERRDLTTELTTIDNGVDLGKLEADFVAVAKDYGQRKNISYGSWREVGVPAATLARAGIIRAT